MAEVDNFAWTYKVKNTHQIRQSIKLLPLTTFRACCGLDGNGGIRKNGDVKRSRRSRAQIRMITVCMRTEKLVCEAKTRWATT